MHLMRQGTEERRLPVSRHVPPYQPRHRLQLLQPRRARAPCGRWAGRRWREGRRRGSVERLRCLDQAEE
jgi:hypothetical protein